VGLRATATFSPAADRHDAIPAGDGVRRQPGGGAGKEGAVKLSDLKEVGYIAQQLEKTRQLHHRVSCFGNQLAMTYLYSEAEGRYSIVEVVGGDWMQNAVLTRCEELDKLFVAKLERLGVEVES
jgi:hypothetical protein